ncbi:hypothetical protein C7212DRAFT_345237 [Tuber magnatum]|uniref:Uncharacterized protein n=1 Tax=Tuber magnatum TaxID=42249 RepID=A0A317SNQ1_9PEZI|nr:hypothetical protein C7212DRAFT_345237 [Tuber magnatum]
MSGTGIAYSYFLKGADLCTRQKGTWRNCPHGLQEAILTDLRESIIERYKLEYKIVTERREGYDDGGEAVGAALASCASDRARGRMSDSLRDQNTEGHTPVHAAPSLYSLPPYRQTDVGTDVSQATGYDGLEFPDDGPFLADEGCQLRRRLGVRTIRSRTQSQPLSLRLNDLEGAPAPGSDHLYVQDLETCGCGVGEDMRGPDAQIRGLKSVLVVVALRERYARGTLAKIMRGGPVARGGADPVGGMKQTHRGWGCESEMGRRVWAQWTGRQEGKERNFESNRKKEEVHSGKGKGKEVEKSQKFPRIPDIIDARREKRNAVKEIDSESEWQGRKRKKRGQKKGSWRKEIDSESELYCSEGEDPRKEERSWRKEIDSELELYCREEEDLREKGKSWRKEIDSELSGWEEEEPRHENRSIRKEIASELELFPWEEEDANNILEITSLEHIAAKDSALGPSLSLFKSLPLQSDLIQPAIIEISSD